MQTYGVLTELLSKHNLTHGLIMGGANRQTEALKLAHGINIVVATPGRLLDHLQVNYFMSPCVFDVDGKEQSVKRVRG
jgi:superfamily II DNA/RNA helicase